MDYIEINRNAYNKLAESYKWRKEYKSEFEEHVDVLGNSVLNCINRKFKQSINVLEIGPGAGQMLAFFEQNNCHTIGVELSEKMALVAKTSSPNSVIINADIMTVDFLPCQFQIIYMGALIHLFPKYDAELLLDKVLCWLDKDGVIFINTTCHEYSEEGFFEKSDYDSLNIRFRRYWTEESFMLFVLSHGFVLTKKLYTDECDRGKKWVALVCKKGIINERKDI